MADDLKDRLLKSFFESELVADALVYISELEARLSAAVAGEDSLAEAARPFADGPASRNPEIVALRAALAAHEARRKG